MCRNTAAIIRHTCMQGILLINSSSAGGVADVTTDMSCVSQTSSNLKNEDRDDMTSPISHNIKTKDEVNDIDHVLSEEPWFSR